MTILTGIALVVALGAVAHRSDFAADFFHASVYEPRDDVAAFAPGGVALIDVVANDRGASPVDGRRVLITRAPDCGAAWRHEGFIAYAAGPDCAPEQSLRYCVAHGDACPEAEVRLHLDPRLAGPVSASGTPVTLLNRAEAPRPSGFAALAGPEPARQGGFSVEGPARAEPSDRAPFAALGFPFVAPAEARTD